MAWVGQVTYRILTYTTSAVRMEDAFNITSVLTLHVCIRDLVTRFYPAATESLLVSIILGTSFINPLIKAIFSPDRSIVPNHLASVPIMST